MPIQKAKGARLTRDDVSQALFEIGQREVEMQQIEADLNKSLDELKAAASPRLEALREEIDGRKRDLRLAVEDGRRDLLPGKRKSLAVLMGKVGFRSRLLKVRIVKGADAESVLARIKRAADSVVRRFVRSREELNKAEVAEALRQGQVTREQLDKLGVDVVEGGEDFYYQVDHAKVLDRIEGD